MCCDDECRDVEDDGSRHHIPPVYDPPRMGYAPEPGSGAGLGMTLSIVGLLIGLFHTCPPNWEWIFQGLIAASAIGLFYSSRAWWRAIHE